MAWVRRPDETADALRRDPRDFGIFEDHLSLVQILRDYTTMEAKWVRIEDGTQRLQVRKKSPKGLNMVLFLDPAKAMLPSLFGYVGADGNFSWATKIEYQEVNAGAGWFPMKASSKGFAAGAGKDFERDAPSQIQTVAVTKLELDGPVEDNEFQQSIPEGVKVFNNLVNKTVTVGQSQRPSVQAWSVYRMLAWASASLAALLALGGFVFYYFRRRRKLNERI